MNYVASLQGVHPQYTKTLALTFILPFFPCTYFFVSIFNFVHLPISSFALLSPILLISLKLLPMHLSDTEGQLSYENGALAMPVVDSPPKQPGTEIASDDELNRDSPSVDNLPRVPPVDNIQPHESSPQEYGLRDISSTHYDRPVPRGPSYLPPVFDHQGIRSNTEPTPQEQVFYKPENDAIFHVTRALFIANLRKPLNAAKFQSNLKRVVAQGGHYQVERAWLNRARTHAIVLVSSEDGAAYLRDQMVNTIYPPALDEEQLRIEYEEREQRRYEREIADGVELPRHPEVFIPVDRIPLYVDFIPVKAINQWVYEEDHGPRDGQWKIEYERVGEEIIASHTLLNGSYVPEFRHRGRHDGHLSRRGNRDGRRNNHRGDGRRDDYRRENYRREELYHDRLRDRLDLFARDKYPGHVPTGPGGDRSGYRNRGSRSYNGRRDGDDRRSTGRDRDSGRGRNGDADRDGSRAGSTRYLRQRPDEGGRNGLVSTYLREPRDYDDNRRSRSRSPQGRRLYAPDRSRSRSPM